jgi:hypothetical protein
MVIIAKHDWGGLVSTHCESNQGLWGPWAQWVAIKVKSQPLGAVVVVSLVVNLAPPPPLQAGQQPEQPQGRVVAPVGGLESMQT